MRKARALRLIGGFVRIPLANKPGNTSQTGLSGNEHGVHIVVWSAGETHCKTLGATGGGIAESGSIDDVNALRPALTLGLHLQRNVALRGTATASVSGRFDLHPDGRYRTAG